jgi:hypothetical protein
MSVITRYFDASGAGTADGTSWANRAALYTGGAWSSVIRSFAFNGSDSLLCLVNGTITIGDTLTTADFTNAPTYSNPLLFHGCDASGNPLTVPDPDWVSAMPAWDDTTLPVLQTTTNISTLSFTTGYNVHGRLLKFTSSAAAQVLVGSNGVWDWCSFANSTSNTSAALINGGRLVNCIGSVTGTSYSHCFGGTNQYWSLHNCRVTGVTGSSGNRYGFSATSASGGAITQSTVAGCGGVGIHSGSGNAMGFVIRNCTIRNAGGNGIQLTTGGAPTNSYILEGNMITGAGGYGIDADTQPRGMFGRNRLRDNTSGNFGNVTNMPTDWDNYTTDSDDATEYVDTASGDLRIARRALIWPYGFGAGRQDPGGLLTHPGMAGGMRA